MIARFLAGVGKVILWVLAVVGGLTTVIVAAVIAFSLHARTIVPTLPDQALLHLDLNAPLVEHHAVSFDFATEKSLSLHEVIRSLRLAAGDPRITAVVADLGEGSLGIAQTQELADALALFRQSGKKTYAFARSLENFGNGSTAYYLAAGFDQIYLQPTSQLGLIGYAIEIPFIADALERFHITADFGQRHEYKGGIDSYVRNGLSDTLRQSLQALIDGWHAQLVTHIADQRSALSKEKLQALINNGPLLAEEAVAAGLIDKLAFAADFVDDIIADQPEVTPDLYLAVRDHDQPVGQIIAIITGQGVITTSEKQHPSLLEDQGFDVAGVIEALALAAEDPEIAAVVLRIDSPGGAYGPSAELYHAVSRFRTSGKPLVASIGNIAASGGYFALAGADKIYASPGSLTGSIGVYSGKFALDQLLQEWGINIAVLKSADQADIWSSARAFNPTARARFDAGLDAVYQDFTQKVAAGRGLDAQEIDQAARGRVWLGAVAPSVKLVDEMGGLWQAIDGAAALANLQERGGALSLRFLPEPVDAISLFVESLQGMLGEGVHFRAKSPIDLLFAQLLRLSNQTYGVGHGPSGPVAALLANPALGASPVLAGPFLPTATGGQGPWLVMPPIQVR